MAPLKQPSLLKQICINSASHIFTSYAVMKGSLQLSEKWENLVQKYLEDYVPPILHSELLHAALHSLATQNKDAVTPEVLSHVITLLLHSRITELSLSDLTYAGAKSYETLDAFEDMLSSCLPFMPNLTHLDLSTHHSEVSLPSCSTEVLSRIGSHCPNLRILNLNNNNRVTGQSLWGLYPNGHQTGCHLLEEIFLQDCSVTPIDVAYLLESFQHLRIVGFQDMGIVLRKLRKMFYGRHYKQKPLLNLTHIDNTNSTSCVSDGSILAFVSKTCPRLENVRLRVCDEDLDEVLHLKALKILELRFYTGIHHPVGTGTLSYLQLKGDTLNTLTIYCDSLESQHVFGVAANCVNLTKLFLHANTFAISEDWPLIGNNLTKLEIVNIRIGQDEMDQSPDACDLVYYILLSSYVVKEAYLLLRCVSLTQDFFQDLLAQNPLSELKTLICDAPRRNLSVPLLDLTLESALLITETCAKLETLGNLICWALTSSQVDELRDIIKKRNLNLNIIYSTLNKKSSKYF